MRLGAMAARWAQVDLDLWIGLIAAVVWVLVQLANRGVRRRPLPPQPSTAEPESAEDELRRFFEKLAGETAPPPLPPPVPQPKPAAPPPLPRPSSPPPKTTKPTGDHSPPVSLPSKTPTREPVVQPAEAVPFSLTRRRDLLANRRAVRRAIIAAELLAPPLALR